MTAFYGTFDRDAQEEESLKTIAKALDLGINLLDTAWIYQVIRNIATDLKYQYAYLISYILQCVGEGGRFYTNEELVGKAIKIHGREKFVICTKFGISATSVSDNSFILLKQKLCHVNDRTGNCWRRFQERKTSFALSWPTLSPVWAPTTSTCTTCIAWILPPPLRRPWRCSKV